MLEEYENGPDMDKIGRLNPLASTLDVDGFARGEELEKVGHFIMCGTCQKPIGCRRYGVEYSSQEISHWQKWHRKYTRCMSLEAWA